VNLSLIENDLEPPVFQFLFGCQCAFGDAAMAIVAAAAALAA
jgi:hypothetical protein